MAAPRFFPGATGQIYKQFGLTIAFPSRFYLLASPSLLPSPPYCCGETRGTTWRTRRVWVFRSRDQLVLIGLIALTKCARGMIAQLPGPHPSDRACRLCGAVGADGLALYRRTYRISPNEDQGYFISIIQAPEGLR